MHKISERRCTDSDPDVGRYNKTRACTDLTETVLHHNTQQALAVRQHSSDYKYPPSISLKKDLRAAFLNKEAIDGMGKSWVLETPYDIRDAAMEDLLKAYDSAHARYKNDKKVFKIKHRSRRKCCQESIVVHHKHWSRTSGKYAFLHKMKSAEPLPHDLKYDSRLLSQRTTGHYYLCVPMPLQVLEGPSSGRLIYLDTGVRTFLTGYKPDGKVVELGKNDIGHIYRLCHWLDELHSKYSAKDITRAKRWRMKKAAGKLRRRIQNLVSDMHCRIAKYLCSTFNLVVLPSFPVQQMVTRKGGQRRIRSKTARAMATWSHYKFQQRLLDKAREYKSCKVVLVSEEYTRVVKSTPAENVGLSATAMSMVHDIFWNDDRVDGPYCNPPVL
ncbi:hypothetical protein V1505DRAFT_385130 [Lipomyces doorenjongii]